MKASLNWLKRLVELRETPEEIAEHLTAVGLEVEDVERVNALPGVVVGEVRSCEKVEGTKLSLCRVFDGLQELQVVCGAPNVRAGIKAPLATVGTASWCSTIPFPPELPSPRPPASPTSSSRSTSRPTAPTPPDTSGSRASSRCAWDVRFAIRSRT